MVLEKQFKISCHAIGSIMAGAIGLTAAQQEEYDKLTLRKHNSEAGVAGVKPLTKNMEEQLAKLQKKIDHPELPEGAKTYCKKWLKKALFNCKEDWKSVVIEKGLVVEADAIQLVGQVYGENLSKNEDFFSNDYAQGSPDVLTMTKVRDIKSSWDLFTFPMFDEELPKEEYWWQLQGYMWLTGIEQASLDYVLVNTPMPLVLMDLRKLYFQSGGVAEEWTPDKYEELYPNYRFDNVPLNMRVKSFVFNYEPWVADQIAFRVVMCREYIQKIIDGQIAV